MLQRGTGLMLQFPSIMEYPGLKYTDFTVSHRLQLFRRARDLREYAQLPAVAADPQLVEEVERERQAIFAKLKDLP